MSDTKSSTVTFDEGYEVLLIALMDAFRQAEQGKGKDRHAKNGAAFEDQPIFTIAREHGLAFLTGQAAKKLSEIYTFLSDEDDDGRFLKAYNELAGAVVYTAAAMIHVSRMMGEFRMKAVSATPVFPKTREAPSSDSRITPNNPPSSPVEARSEKTLPEHRAW